MIEEPEAVFLVVRRLEQKYLLCTNNLAYLAEMVMTRKNVKYHCLQVFIVINNYRSERQNKLLALPIIT